MKDSVLVHFRDLAGKIGRRDRTPVTVEFTRKKTGEKEVIEAKYDGLFDSVELPVGTFPKRELRTWLKLFYGADTTTVKIIPNR